MNDQKTIARKLDEMASWAWRTGSGATQKQTWYLAKLMIEAGDSEQIDFWYADYASDPEGFTKDAAAFHINDYLETARLEEKYRDK